MNVISKRFADELGDDKAMRDAFCAALTRTKIANQIRVIRAQRGWSQGEFARLLGKPQSNVSRLENREYGNFTLATLLELAAAFDVGLQLEFVPYDEFLTRTHDLTAGRLEVPAFSRGDLEALYNVAERANTPIPESAALRDFLGAASRGQNITQKSVRDPAPVPPIELSSASHLFGQGTQINQSRLTT